MATVECILSALGTEPPCAGCGEPFARAEQMYAVVASGGESLGWFCELCIKRRQKRAVEDFGDEED